MDRPPTIRIALFASAVVGGALYQVCIWAPAHDRELIARYEQFQSNKCWQDGGVWITGVSPPYCAARRIRKGEK